jgi:hypothetical protein
VLPMESRSELSVNASVRFQGCLFEISRSFRSAITRADGAGLADVSASDTLAQKHAH